MKYIQTCSLLLISLCMISFNNYAFAVDNTIERVAITHSGKTRQLHQALTSDNTVIEVSKVVTSQRSTADIIAQTAGVNLNGQGGLFQSYNIRGFSKGRLKTEVNGISIISDRRAGNSLSFIPTSIVDSVYLQKGPNSTLYGTGAMGGVVSLSTIDAPSTVKLSFQPQGSINNNTTDALVRYADDSMSIGLVHRQADKEKAANNTILNSQFEQTYLQASLNKDINDLTVKAFTALSKGRDIGKSSSEFPNETITIYPHDDHWLSQIELSHNEQWLIRLYHHNQDWQSDTKTIEDSHVNRSNITTYQSDTFGTYATYLLDNTQLGIEWIGRRNITIEEKEFNTLDEFQFSNQSVDADEDNVGAYISHHWAHHKFTVNSGVRFDHISISQREQSKSDQFLSFSLDTHYQVNPKTDINFQVANAFRFPSVSELFFSGNTPRGNTQGNELLKPEESLGYQLSVSHQFNKILKLEAHSYLYYVDNYIERYRINDDLRSFRNTNEVTIKGAELTATWQLSSALSSAIGAQIQSSKDGNNSYVDDAIPNAIKWNINWQGQGFTINNQLNYQFSFNNFGPSEQALDSQVIWNASVAYQLQPNLNVTAALYNITDTLYYGSADEDAAYQPERTINFTVQWMFN